MISTFIMKAKGSHMLLHWQLHSISWEKIPAV